MKQEVYQCPGILSSHFGWESELLECTVRVVAMPGPKRKMVDLTRGSSSVILVCYVWRQQRCMNPLTPKFPPEPLSFPDCRSKSTLLCPEVISFP